MHTHRNSHHGALFLLLARLLTSILIGAAAAESLADPLPTAAHEPAKLRGGVSITDVASPLPLKQWDETVLPRLQVGCTLSGNPNVAPEGYWYKVPASLAGKWRLTTDGAVGSSRSTITIGRKVDLQGEVWDFSRGFVTSRPWKESPAQPNCEVLNVMGVTLLDALDSESFTTAHRDIAITYSLQDKRVIRALVSMLTESYQLESGQLQKFTTMTHIINNGFTGVSPKSQDTATYTRMSKFSDDQSPEVTASFRNFLTSHGMADRVPIMGTNSTKSAVSTSKND